MGQLMKTTEAEDGHYHLVYVGDDGSITTSVDEDHGHSVELSEATGQPVLSFGIDGHTHELIPLPESTRREKKEDEDQIVGEVLSEFQSLLESEEENRKWAHKSEDYYCGEQWDEGDRSTLEGSGRACLTINEIQRHLDELIGYQRQNRTDLRYLPMEGGDQRVADILNVAAKQITEQCFYEREETESFSDASIVGRGALNIRMDFSQDLEGEIKIEHYPWYDVVFGPHLKADLSDCEIVVKHKRISRSKLEQLYPKKADEVATGLSMLDDFESTAGSQTQHAVGHYTKAENWRKVVAFNTAGIGMMDITRKDIRVVERWKKIYKRVDVVVALQDGFYFNAENLSKKDVSKLKTIPTISVVERGITKIRITRIAGGVLLSDQNPADMADDDFFIVPIYASRRGNRWWGKVRPAIDPQMELNKRHSQAIDIGNRAVSYGWMIDHSTFQQEREEMEFKDKVTTPGFVAKVADLNRPPMKIEGTRFPAELAELMSISSQQISSLMNIRVESSGANESAQHLMQMKQARLTGNEYLFDNLSFAKKKIGRLLVKLIQKYYSPQRIYRILVNQAQRGQVEIAGQPLQNYSPDEIINLLENTDLTKYDVIVSETAHSPTTRLANFMLLSDLARNSGIPIPPEALIGLMDLPEEEKAKIVQGIQSQQQAQASQQSATADMEITKTLIAQGLVPPKVAQQYGVQGAPAQPQDQGQQAPMQAPPGLQI